MSVGVPSLPDRDSLTLTRVARPVPDLIDWSNAAGKTALHVASQSGNAELVQVRGQAWAFVLNISITYGSIDRHCVSWVQMCN